MNLINTATSRVYVGDFETTVFEGQTNTAVWASAVVELNTEDVKVFSSIWDTFDYLNDIACGKRILIYYHNLKFDGEFWVSYLNSIGYTQAFNETLKRFIKDSEMPVKSYKYVISDRGQWYKIIIKSEYGIIEIRDSLKLLPFSVQKIGESFGTKHRKTEIEYEGLRAPGGIISKKEEEYIKNDVLVVKEALEIMYYQGHNKLTIGACCLAEFKATFFR